VIGLRERNERGHFDDEVTLTLRHKVPDLNPNPNYYLDDDVTLTLRHRIGWTGG
jgi:hypothetical protein